jgi:hypothetical protein
MVSSRAQAFSDGTEEVYSSLPDRILSLKEGWSKKLKGNPRGWKDFMIFS